MNSKDFNLLKEARKLSTLSNSMNRKKIKKELMLKASDFSIFEKYIRSEEKHKLGQIYKCTLKSEEEILCRIIDFDRLTNYQIEAYYNELSKINQLEMDQYILPTRGIYIKDDCKIHIFKDKMISLNDLLYS